MRQISKLRKDVGYRVVSALSVTNPTVHEMWDDDRKNVLDILSVRDCPQTGVNSYATFGLSDSPLLKDGKEFSARVELIGACGAAFPDMDRVISTAAFCVINSGWFCAPGIIFPGIMEMYSLSKSMSDIYFAHPFLWEDELRSTTIDGRTIAWLLVVPVSKRETEFARKYGSSELEKLFAKENIDIFNYNRASIV